jgi:GNAT superfamily N-acetyltransferase
MILAAPRGELTRRHGRPCPPVGFVGRWLDDGEVGAVITLHRTVRAAIAPELLCRESDDFFIDHSGRVGNILGLFAEDRLIAYGVLGLPPVGEPSFADDFALTAGDRAAAATVDGAAVLPEWRGNRLHRRLVAERLRRAREQGRRIALSTVAPGNLPSLRNLLAEGLTIRALRARFGGMRYLVRRDLDRPPAAPPQSGRWISVHDVAAQTEALDRGEIGWALAEDRADAPAVWFGAPNRAI